MCVPCRRLVLVLVPRRHAMWNDVDPASHTKMSRRASTAVSNFGHDHEAIQSRPYINYCVCVNVRVCGPHAVSSNHHRGNRCDNRDSAA